jgi:hypothetical protein
MKRNGQPIANYVRDEHYGYLKIEMCPDQRRCGFPNAGKGNGDPYSRILQTMGKKAIRAGK